VIRTADTCGHLVNDYYEIGRPDLGVRRGVGWPGGRSGAGEVADASASGRQFPRLPSYWLALSA